MASPTLVVNVLGLSRLDGENFSSRQGIGKSCLCYRFVYPGYDDYVEGHRSLLASQEFESDVIHKDHFLYWGSTTRTYDSKGSLEKVHFEVLEYTAFYEDITDQPFGNNSKRPVTSFEGYTKMAVGSPLESPGKISYKNRDLICYPQEYESVVFPPGIGKHPRGYVVVVDVSDSGPGFESRLRLTENMVAHLVKKKQKFVVAATKRDEAFTTSLEKLGELARVMKFTLIEVSAKSNVNVSEAFEIVAVKVLSKAAHGIPTQVLSYQDAAKKTLSNRDRARRAFRSFLQKRVTLGSERLKALECTEEYKACAQLHGKFETDKMFAQHVLTVRNDEVSCYAGVTDNVEMRQEFLEDYVAERTDLSLYANYLKDFIIKICQKCNNEVSSSPPPPLTPSERKTSLTCQTFIPIQPNPQHYAREFEGDHCPRNGGDTQNKVSDNPAEVHYVSDDEEPDTKVEQAEEDDGNYVPVNNELDCDTDGNNSDYEPMQVVDTSDDDEHNYINTSEIPGLNSGRVATAPLPQQPKEEEKGHGKGEQLPLARGNTPCVSATASSVACVDPSSPLGRSKEAQDQLALGGSPASSLQRKKGPPPPLKSKPALPKRTDSLKPDPSKNGSTDPGTMTKLEDGVTSAEDLKQVFEPGNSRELTTAPSVMSSSVTTPTTESTQVEKPLLTKIREKVEKEKAKNKPPSSPPVPSPKSDHISISSSTIAPSKPSSPHKIAIPTSPCPGQVSDPTYPMLISTHHPLKPPPTSPRFAHPSEPAAVTPPYLPVSTDLSCRPTATSPQPRNKVMVSTPIPCLTTVQLSQVNRRESPNTDPSNTDPGEERRASSPSPPPPPLPDRPEDDLCQDGSERKPQAGENSPAPSRIKRAYESVVKKFTWKSSNSEESQQPAEPIQESNPVEPPRKTTFLDMKKRPLPPEPSPDGGRLGHGNIGGHGNDSDEDLHDYEPVLDDGPGAFGWMGRKPPHTVDVRRAKSFNATSQNRCDSHNCDYENEGERPRLPEPTLRCPSPTVDEDKPEYDYPKIPGTIPTLKLQKPVPPRRVKLDSGSNSMSPSPHHSPGTLVGGICATNSVDSYMNADSQGKDFASLDDSYINWAPEESQMSQAKPHSHSLEDLSVYMNLPLPDPAPTRPPTTSPSHLTPRARPPPINPRPPRSQTNMIPRTTLDPLSSSLPARGLGTQVQRAPGVVTKALPPRNIMRRPPGGQ